MVKGLVVFLLFVSLEASVYTENCIPCHRKLPVSIDKFFYRYLLKYSSEIETKFAIKEYLKNPKREDSVLNEALLKRFGVKKRSKLTDRELDSAIDEYWEKYKVFGKLK